MHPSAVNAASEMAVTSSAFARGRSNPNLAATQTSATGTPNEMSANYHFSYPDLAAASASSLNYVDLLRAWHYQRFFISPGNNDPLSDNSPTDYHPRNGSFHQFYPRLLSKPVGQQTDDEIFLSKFHHDTQVNLDSGEAKNIQQLTTNDFLASATRSSQYASVLARVEYITPVDKSTGKAELRLHLEEIDKMTTYCVLVEMPFFVYQHSCWSSISPEHTYQVCGLKCRQLECGDIIIAITEQRKISPLKVNEKPDYSQQSPTKCLVGRYIHGQASSSNKRHKISNE